MPRSKEWGGASLGKLPGGHLLANFQGYAMFSTLSVRESIPTSKSLLDRDAGAALVLLIIRAGAHAAMSSFRRGRNVDYVTASTRLPVIESFVDDWQLLVHTYILNERCQLGDDFFYRDISLQVTNRSPMGG